MESEENEKHESYLRFFHIDVEVGLNKNLDRTSLLLFSVINGLDHCKKHCTASNAYLASCLDVIPNTISASLSSLIKQEYVELIHFDGKTRTIRINPNYKTIHKNIKDESDLRISCCRKGSRLPNANDLGRNSAQESRQPNADDLGSLMRMNEHIKDIEDKKNSVSHSVISGNFVPTKKRIIILSKREIIKRDKTNLVPVFRKEKKQPPLVVSSAVQEVIDYWKSFGFKVPKESTKGFRDAVKDINNVLNGTRFTDYTEPTFKPYTNQKYSVKDIKSAIDFHKSRRKNINYLPTNKDYLESITLSNFFFNRYSTIEETKSEFLICIAQPLVKTTNNSKLLLKDDLPNVTKLLTDWYKKTFSYKINGSYSMRDRNVIIRSGLKLKAFSETNKDKLTINEEHCRMYRITNDPVLYLAKALIHFWDNEISRNGGLLEKFEINFLASENLLTTKFPKFLKEEKAMR